MRKSTDTPRGISGITCTSHASKGKAKAQSRHLIGTNYEIKKVCARDAKLMPITLLTHVIVDEVITNLNACCATYAAITI